MRVMDIQTNGDGNTLFATEVFHRFVKPDCRRSARKGHSLALDPDFEQLDRGEEPRVSVTPMNAHRLDRADPVHGASDGPGSSISAARARRNVKGALVRGARQREPSVPGQARGVVVQRSVFCAVQAVGTGASPRLEQSCGPMWGRNLKNALQLKRLRASGRTGDRAVRHLRLAGRNTRRSREAAP